MSTPLHAYLDYLTPEYNGMFSARAWRSVKDLCRRSGRPLHEVSRYEVEDAMIVEMSSYNAYWRAYKDTLRRKYTLVVGG